MIDFIKLSVPFKDTYTMTTQEVNGVSTDYVDIQKCAVRGVPLEARNIEYVGGADNSGYEISDIRHPYESLPSSFSGLSFKIFQGTPLRSACVELKGSP
ncbi:phage/plasmid replication protein, II/X family, partial [Vibrio breoganii]